MIAAKSYHVKQLLQAKFLPSAVSGRFEDSVLSFQRVVCDGRQGHCPLEPHARLVLGKPVVLQVADGGGGGISNFRVRELFLLPPLSDKKIFQDDPALLVKGVTGKTLEVG